MLKSPWWDHYCSDFYVSIVLYVWQMQCVAFHFLTNHIWRTSWSHSRMTKPRFIRLKLWNNSHEESFPHMNRLLKLIESLRDVLEETFKEGWTLVKLMHILMGINGASDFVCIWRQLWNLRSFTSLLEWFPHLPSGVCLTDTPERHISSGPKPKLGLFHHNHTFLQLTAVFLPLRPVFSHSSFSASFTELKYFHACVVFKRRLPPRVQLWAFHSWSC